MRPQQKHINTLNLKTAFEMFERGVTLPPGVLEWMRRMQHRLARLDRYRRRNAAYPYSSKRQMGANCPAGVNRYAFQQGPRVPNPKYWTGRHFAHLGRAS